MIQHDLSTGDRYWPTTDIRISPREILAPFFPAERRAEDRYCLFIRYRTFDDGRGIPLIRTCTIYSFLRWINKWKATKTPPPASIASSDDALAERPTSSPGNSNGQ